MVRLLSIEAVGVREWVELDQSFFLHKIFPVFKYYCSSYWCTDHILTSSVVYNGTDPGQHGINLFFSNKTANSANGDVIYASVSQ